MTRHFEELFAKAEWFKPDLQGEFARDWVRYRNDDNPTGVCWFVPAESEKPILSVIIPTADADRGGYFVKLMQSLTQQDTQDFELIVMKGDKRQGRAINIAAAGKAGRI